MNAEVTGLRRLFQPLPLYALGMLLVFVAERLLGEGHDARLMLDGVGGGLLLLCLVVAASQAARATGDARRIGWRRLLHLILGVVGVGVYGASLSGGPLSQGDAQTLAQVGWPILWICGTLPVALISASLRGAAPGPRLEARRVLDSGSAGLAMALALSWLVALNYIADSQDRRFDYRTVKEVTASEATVEMVRNLQEPVTVTLFFAPADEVAEAVAPYFNALVRVNERLVIERLDRDMVPKRAREMRVRDNGSVVVSRGEVQEAISLGTDPAKARRKLQKLDQSFQEKLAKVSREQKVVYIVSGHGERSYRPGADDPLPGLKDFRKVMEVMNYAVKKLSLPEGLGDDVPDDATLVVVAGPTSPMLPAEHDALIRYVKRGGAIMLLVDPDVESDPELSPLLDVLGVSVQSTPLAHDTKFVRLNRKVRDRGVLFTNRFMAHDSTRTLARLSTKLALVFPVTGSVLRKTLDPEPNVKVTVRSLSGTWADADGDLENGEDEERQVFDLVAAVELSASEPGQTGGRAIVAADADLISDQILRLNAGNQQWLVDAVRWLEDEIELSGEVAAVEDVPILHSREEDKALFYGSVVAVPLALFALAGLMWRRRRRGEG